MFSITRKINFEMAHRIHNQDLDPELSLNSVCKCKRIHGHSYEVELTLESTELEKGMVTDLGNLKSFEAWVKHTFDHRLLLFYKDPMLLSFLGKNMFDTISSSDIPEVLLFKDFSENFLNRVSYRLNDLEDSLTLCKVEPTSENLAYVIWNSFPLLNTSYGKLLLQSVKVKESPNGYASYTY